MNFMSQQNNASNAEDKQAAQTAIQAAYQEATPEEKQQLQQLENQLRQHNQIQ